MGFVQRHYSVGVRVVVIQISKNREARTVGAYCKSPPPRSLRVRYTRRIDFRKDARWGYADVTGHTASRNSAGSPTESATAPVAYARGSGGPAKIRH